MGITLLKLAIVTLALVTGVAFQPQSTQAQQARQSTPITVFLNVNVIPMDRERVLRNQTVVVRDGVIVKMGDAGKVAIPSNALRIDGRGRYLMPGLVDMHTHLFSDDEFPDEFAEDELFIMLANGVTTARLMIGTPEHLVLCEKISRGDLLAPTLFVASPQITGRKQGSVFNGRVVTTPEEARTAVRDFKVAGYDFIKLTNFITPPVYDAVIETARETGIRVVGHVDTNVGLPRALEARQQIEHLDAYLESVLRHDSPIKASVSDIGLFRKQNWESLDFIDERKVREIARATAKAGVYSTPTLTFFKITFGTGASEEEIRARPDYRFYTPRMRETWHAALKRIATNAASETRRREYVRVRNLLVKEIHDAGGKIMAGSDSPEAFLLYGWSLHREIKNLNEAGLSAYAALESATRTPAEFLGTLQTSGTIAQGKRADLLLLTANPLEDISATERRAGVMVNGNWLPEAELQNKLNQIAIRFQSAGSN